MLILLIDVYNALDELQKNLSYKAFKSPFKSIKHSTYFDVYDELFTSIEIKI